MTSERRIDYTVLVKAVEQKEHQRWAIPMHTSLFLFAFLVSTTTSFSMESFSFQPNRDFSLIAAGAITGVAMVAFWVYVVDNNNSQDGADEVRVQSLKKKDTQKSDWASFKREVLNNEQLRQAYIIHHHEHGKPKINYDAVLHTMKAHCNSQITAHHMVGTMLISDVLPHMVQNVLVPVLIKTLRDAVVHTT